ncbi:MAG: right-handed parallel beta-helix repeat-containing protein, partial [Candidatus Pacebacteria bacterium]|nr:right-handed parallel beta-helix repeat-containing protein [Candidatus Paceibacterota bacterium]
MQISKTKLFLHLFISSFFLFGLTGITNATDIWVTAPVTATTINSAIVSALPGDCVIIPDGTYSAIGQIKVPASIEGTGISPIILKSATPGGVTFTGNCASPLMFIQGDWWVIRDFKFVDVSEVGDANTKGIYTRDATGVRITNNYFDGFGVLTNTDKNSWCVYIGNLGTGNNSFVDYNTFTECEAVSIVISSGSLNCNVNHNYFNASLKDGENGFEGIHMGDFGVALNCITEYNLFENMSADPESISNKSSNNTYRYNVFKSTGSGTCNGLVLRGGDDCTVDGNYFFDVEKNSIRIHGTGHKIINNYFENPAHNAILLADGGIEYANVSDILIANNTIVNTPVRGIYIGWWPGGNIKPNNLTFKNNIIKSSTGALVRDEGHTGTFIWENNLHYATGGATYWQNAGGVPEPTGIAHADPNFTFGYGIQRLQSTSNNAIQKGTPVAGITDDIDGHSRDAANPDIGCDEYSGSAPIRKPISEDEVGVSWLMAGSADHNWYFSMSGGGNVCSQVAPCKWLSSNQVGYVTGQTTAQDKIDSVASNKIVNLYFKMGDVWSFDTDIVSTTRDYGLSIKGINPIVNVDAYGSGNKPKFYGTVSKVGTWFDAVPDHNITTGPLKWNRIFQVERDYCTFKNIHVDGIYGRAIYTPTASIADSLIIESCAFTNIGNVVFYPSSSHGTENTIITNNLIHTVGQLCKYGKQAANCGPFAVSFAPWSNTLRSVSGNIFRHNVIYDIYGEGVHGYGYTAEYNIVGDTASYGIYVCPSSGDATNTIIRNNIVMQSSSLVYRSNPVSGCNGIGIANEIDGGGGDNSNATIEIYGNIVINRNLGISVSDYDVISPEPWGGIKIYNNIVIDCAVHNYYMGNYDAVVAGQGFFYNNSSILYDRPGSKHMTDQGNPIDLSTYWDISHNHFWTIGGSPTVDTDWQTNMITTDPKLTGEPAIDWDGQSGPTYYKDIKFSDVIPLAGSSLIGSGKTLNASYNKTFLTQGTDFSTLPNSPNFMLSSQTDGSWDIGAVEVGGAIITCVSLGGTCCAPLQICQGGSAAISSCSNVCCVGGTCQNVTPPPLPPPPPPTCQ